MGRKSVLKKIFGLTLVEVLLSMVLLSMVFLAVSALFVGSQKFYLSSNDKIMLSYELQYAMDHIYKNVMLGIGGVSDPSITVTGSPPEMNELEFSVRLIDEPDNPSTEPTYGDYTDDIEITYSITGEGKLSYVKKEIDTGTVLEQDTDLLPKVTLLFGNDPDSGEKYSRFYKEENVLQIKLTAEYPLVRPGRNEAERVTAYTACYPRQETFQ